MKLCNSKIVLAAALLVSACGGDDKEESAPPSLGTISIISTQDSPEEFHFTVLGNLGESTGEDPQCTRRTEGDCTVTTCGPPGPDGGVYLAQSAGTLTVSGGLLPAPGVTIEPGEDNRYFYSGSSKPWEPGQQITLKGSGAQVPAFEVSVSVPPNFALEAPTLLPYDQEMVLARTTPLELRWTATPEPKVVSLISLVNVSTGTPLGRASCQFAGSTTAATVPASVLGALPKGEATFSVFTSNNAKALVGGKSIRLHARVYAGGSSGRSASRNVILD